MKEEEGEGEEEREIGGTGEMEVAWEEVCKEEEERENDE